MTIKEFRRTFAINLIVFIALSASSTLFLELVLRRTDWLDEIKSERPSYIPRELKIADRLIDASGVTDTYGFRSSDGRDKIAELQNSSPTKCKVVVIGDSFIWGDGVKIEKTWASKFKNLSDCNVYDFGKNGWTHLEQFAFYEAVVKDLDIDLVIFGVVHNDPHISQREDYPLVTKNSKFNVFSKVDPLIRINFGITGLRTQHNRYPTESRLMTAYLKLSNRLHGFIVNHSEALDYLDQKVARLFEEIVPIRYIKMDIHDANPYIFTNGSSGWLYYLYQQDNFMKYSKLIETFSEVKKHRTLFALTPRNPATEEYMFSKIKRVISSNSMEYIDCSVIPQSLYGNTGYYPRKYWANLADGHPGDSLTEGYAKCVNSYVVNILKK